MKTVWIVSSLFFLGILSLPIYAGQSQPEPKFKVVFRAIPSNAQNTTWLTAIKQRWGATGVCLRVLWGDVESYPNQFYWTDVDQQYPPF